MKWQARANLLSDSNPANPISINQCAKGSASSGSSTKIPDAMKRLHIGKQVKHIPGHNNYQPSRNRSILSHSDPQGLLDQHAGAGQPQRGTPGQLGYGNRVDFGQVVGFFVDQSTGARSPTTVGVIHYSSTVAHIVPARPGGAICLA